jgi:toxin ParE1/3/4
MPTSTAPSKPRPLNSPRKGSDLPRLKMLPSAQADLVNILEHITRESGQLTIGRRFVGALRQQCRDLAALPGTLGRVRPELRPDIRSFPYKGYVILFRYVGDTFEVANIIEGHRDIEALYKDL